METVVIQPLNFALRYDPPMLLLHYHMGTDITKEFVHQVNVMLKEGASAGKIVTELLNEEPIYFNPKLVPRGQVNRMSLVLIHDSCYASYSN